MTNYELSKKLKEIKFSKLTDFYYVADAKCISKGEDAEDYNLEYLGVECGNLHKLKDYFCIPSYNLETLLEALPEVLVGVVGKLTINKNGLFYKDSNIVMERQRDESLADTAARLLILIHEKQLLGL